MIKTQKAAEAMPSLCIPSSLERPDVSFFSPCVRLRLHFLQARLRPVPCTCPTPPTSPRLRPAVPPSRPPSPHLPLLPLGGRAALHARPLPPVVSPHPAINSLFHSQGYDKVIMHGPCAAPCPRLDVRRRAHVHARAHAAPRSR